MEFFRELAVDADATKLQSLLTLAQLPKLCASIHQLEDQTNENEGRIGCLWGSFSVHRESIRNGVRFSLPGCPNALAWTITREDEGVTIHCTINRRSHDPDFIESIEEFVQDWSNGLQRMLPEAAQSA